MSVTLTPEVEQQIQSWIERGRFTDASSVVRRALEVLEERESAQYERLKEMVRTGFESGEAVELTDELWDEMEQRSEERFLRGEEPELRVFP